MVILCNYPDQYKGKTLQNFMWLNENASISDFEQTNGLLTRLMDSVNATKDIRGLFNSKHAHIFVAAFKACTESGHGGKGYGEFLGWFVNGGSETEIEGKTWDTLNADRATRDMGTVHGKIDYLVALMGQYFQEIRKAA